MWPGMLGIDSPNSHLPWQLRDPGKVTSISHPLSDFTCVSKCNISACPLTDFLNVNSVERAPRGRKPA
ncbi:hypothetical protein Y1Q_0016327 [Alligator mississippiensis]|uniref:Uncharacterized protein n=1 Tax=Alligator mississippiensis TaxID=8496 RepID=A0A151N2R9_ALLMI|nr:hypothetical protein Y1Q_0016327 [Alligator mississippiensis]